MNNLFFVYFYIYLILIDDNIGYIIDIIFFEGEIVDVWLVFILKIVLIYIFKKKFFMFKSVEII